MSHFRTITKHRAAARRDGIRLIMEFAQFLICTIRDCGNMERRVEAHKSRL